MAMKQMVHRIKKGEELKKPEMRLGKQPVGSGGLVKLPSKTKKPLTRATGNKFSRPLMQKTATPRTNTGGKMMKTATPLAGTAKMQKTKKKLY